MSEKVISSTHLQISHLQKKCLDMLQSGILDEELKHLSNIIKSVIPNNKQVFLGFIIPSNTGETFDVTDEQ
jgi:hypothetical protein